MTAEVVDTEIPDVRAPSMFNIRSRVQHYDEDYDEMGINVTCSERTIPSRSDSSDWCFVEALMMRFPHGLKVSRR